MITFNFNDIFWKIFCLWKFFLSGNEPYITFDVLTGHVGKI